jgi:hypothetical protein
MCSILYLTSYQSTEEPFRRQVEQREREREREYMETKVFIIDKQYREKEKKRVSALISCSVLLAGFLDTPNSPPISFQ